MGIGLVDGRVFRASDNGEAPLHGIQRGNGRTLLFPAVNPLAGRCASAGNSKRTLEEK